MCNTCSDLDQSLSVEDSPQVPPLPVRDVSEVTDNIASLLATGAGHFETSFSHHIKPSTASAVNNCLTISLTYFQSSTLSYFKPLYKYRGNPNTRMSSY